MANFHGFKITCLKSWDGLEGLGSTGKLYLDGKLLGGFTDDGMGGCIRYEFPTTALNDAIKAQLPDLWEEIYGENEYGLTPDLDTVVSHLADMTDDERRLRKVWRDIDKKGRLMVTVDAGDGRFVLMLPKGVSDADAAGAVEGFLRSKGVTGDHDFKVWEELPVLEEGMDKPLSCPAGIRKAAEHRKAMRDIMAKYDRA